MVDLKYDQSYLQRPIVSPFSFTNPIATSLVVLVFLLAWLARLSYGTVLPVENRVYQTNY